jgi:CBS domain-containing protein
MEANLVTVRESSSLLDVVHLLVQANISGVPVVDAAGSVVGVISASDALQAFDQLLDEDQDEAEAAEPLDRVRTLEAGDVATPEVVFVSPTASANEVARVMRHEGIHRVLVGTRERLEGIISAFDLLASV